MIPPLYCAKVVQLNRVVTEFLFQGCSNYFQAEKAFLSIVLTVPLLLLLAKNVMREEIEKVRYFSSPFDQMFSKLTLLAGMAQTVPMSIPHRILTLFRGMPEQLSHAPRTPRANSTHLL